MGWFEVIWAVELVCSNSTDNLPMFDFETIWVVDFNQNLASSKRWPFGPKGRPFRENISNTKSMTQIVFANGPKDYILAQDIVPAEYTKICPRRISKRSASSQVSTTGDGRGSTWKYRAERGELLVGTCFFRSARWFSQISLPWLYKIFDLAHG